MAEKTAQESMSEEAYEAACDAVEKELWEKFENEDSHDEWTEYLNDSFNDWVENKWDFLRADFDEYRKEQFNEGLEERVEALVEERFQAGLYDEKR